MPLYPTEITVLKTEEKMSLIFKIQIIFSFVLGVPRSHAQK